MLAGLAALSVETQKYFLTPALMDCRIVLSVIKYVDVSPSALRCMGLFHYGRASDALRFRT